MIRSSLLASCLACALACASQPRGLERGQTLAARGHCEKALKSFAEAIADAPKSVEARLGRGACLMELKRYEQAAVAFAAALELENSERTLLALAAARAKLNDFDRADALLVQLVDRVEGEDNKNAHRMELATVRVRGGNNTGAIAVLRKVLSVEPKNLDAKMNLGRALLATDQVEEALKVLTGALGQARDDDRLGAPLLVEVGRVFERIGRFDDARRSYRWAENLDKKYPPAHVAEARLLRKEKKVEEAIEMLRMASRFFDDHGPLHYELGLSYLDYGLNEQAASSFEKAVERDPTLSDAHVALLNLLSTKINDPKRRLTALERAAKTLTEHFEIQRDFGVEATLAGQAAKGQEALERAVLLKPNDPDANYALGIAQASTRAYERARESATALEVLDPERATRLRDAIGKIEAGAPATRFLATDSPAQKRGKKRRGKGKKNRRRRR